MVLDAMKRQLDTDVEHAGCIWREGKVNGGMQFNIDFDGTLGAVVYDSTERYRYALYRRWTLGPCVNFCMLNPATATEIENDPTIRRTMGFAWHWGYAGVIVTNLFAFRGGDPNALLAIDDPIGSLNDDFIVAVAKRSALTVVAWGHWGATDERGAEVLELLRWWKGQRTYTPQNVYHLGLTQQGHPKHPLYLRADTERQRWKW